MDSDIKQVKTKGEGDGVYRLSVGDQSVLATRQPDLYFQITLGGQTHKGYLKALKSKFLSWLQTGPTSENTTPSIVKSQDTQSISDDTTKAPSSQTQDQLEKQARQDAKYEARRRAEEAAAWVQPDPNVTAQEKIDQLMGYPMQQVAAYVSAYNNETVSIQMKLAAGESALRYGFRLSKRVRDQVTPPLDRCYDPGRDQYTWPHLFPKDEDVQADTD